MSVASPPSLRHEPFRHEPFRYEPYWWEAARPVPLDAGTLSPAYMSPGYDVAIVGSGLTGLRAALILLRAGRSVVVLDKDAPGSGASRRNAGFLGRVLKKSFDKLVESQGRQQAMAIYRELDEAYQSTMAFIAEEGIDCHAVRCGRFIGATSPAHYELLARELESMKRHLGFDYHMVQRSAQHQEFASDVYHGGAVIPDLGSMHPGLYHKGLLDRVLQAGGQVSGNIEVLAIGRSSAAGRLELKTSRGMIQARNVVVATNGYTPRQFRWHARRLIPFTGYMAATEELPQALLEKVIPRRRTVLGTNLNIDFFRPAPDTPRVLFGGATGSGLTDAGAIADRLKGILARVLPDLAHCGFSHVWSGQCAATFDMMPHIGGRDGVWYGMGYNFAGLPMGSYFGLKIAEKILGRPTGKTVFDTARFPTILLYGGNPWFVPLAMRYFERADRRLAARTRRDGA